MECANCKETLEGEEPAVQELKEDFGKNFEPEDSVVVCDDCYKNIIDWKKRPYH